MRNGLRLAKSAALAATGMAVVMTTPAFAAEEDDDATIVVTARRIEENVQDVPISITVYDQQQISDRNVVNSADLATYTPSLGINNKFGPEKASFVIRGFSQDLNTLPTVGVYFAEAVAPRLNSNITSGNGAGVGSMFDLQNVQVLKGPQGTLFGRNTTGGAILLVPKKPTDRLEGYAEGSVGNHNMLRGQAVINIPLSDTFKVRFGVDRYKRDGYIKNRSGIGPKDFNDVNYTALRLSILAELTPTLENYTIATYSHSNTNGSLGRIAACYTGPAGFTQALFGPGGCAQMDDAAANGFGFYDVLNTLDNPFVRSTTWQVINTTTWEASDTLTVKNIVSYGEAREAYSFNLEGDFSPFPFVTVYPGPTAKQGEQYTLTEELQFQGRTADDRLTWQAGGYMERSNPLVNQTQYTAVFAQCTDPYAFQCVPATAVGGFVNLGSMNIAHNNYYYRNYGLYAQATYKITEQLSITGGFRYTWDRQKELATNIQIPVAIDGSGPALFRCSRVYQPGTTDRVTGGPELLSNDVCGTGRNFSIRSDEPTWSIGLDYKPTEDIMIFAKWVRGYRAGGLNEANQFNEAWEPEFVDDYEIGLKSTFRGGDIRGTFNITGFWNDFKDQQVSVFIPQCVASSRPTCTQPAPTGINGIQNIGTSRLRGIETDGSVMFLDDIFRVDFGYAYLDAKVRSTTPVICNNAAFECANAAFFGPGSTLPYAPKHRFTITGTVTLPVDESIGKISFGATFTHTSKQINSQSDDVAFAAGQLRFPPGVKPYNPGITPSTDLLNLNLNWKGIAGSPVDLALFMTNVTNEKYHVATKGGLSTLGAEWVTLGEPRMYGLRVKINFGE